VVTEAAIPLFGDGDLPVTAGNPQRFTQRWRLVGAGLSNVWRYGDLILPAPSGRLLLRGPNGTGKTTALEALWPYLLDLNAQRLAAGKARPTTLASLMRDGATGKRRCGYVWLSLAAPKEEATSEGEEVHSYGVRLLYTDGGSPPVKVTAFTVPGVPVRDVTLYAQGRESLPHDQFVETIEHAGGQVFTDEDAYVAHLTRRIWVGTEAEARDLAARIRAVRNPTLLGDVSPRGAAGTLREALPGVSDDVVTATAEALAESDATREAFDRDRLAAESLARFAQAWSGHVVEVLTKAHAAAQQAEEDLAEADRRCARLRRGLAAARQAHDAAATEHNTLQQRLVELGARLKAIENSDRYRAAGRLADLEQALSARQRQARTEVEMLQGATRGAADRATQLRATASDLQQDLEELLARVVGPDHQMAAERPLITVREVPRDAYNIGTATADPGAQATIGVDLTAVDELGRRWRELAQQHRVRADSAGLALKDHLEVEQAQEASGAAQAAARAARTEADTAVLNAARASRDATVAVHDMLDQIAAWYSAHPALAPGGSAPLADPDESAVELVDATRWQLSDLMALRETEPAQALAETGRWDSVVRRAAATAMASAQQQRDTARNEAKALRRERNRLLGEADELRAGKLLAIPRPGWAGQGDDEHAFASAVDWHPELDDPTARALLETAMAASGLLGATLVSEGVQTPSWYVTATDTPVEDNLSAVLMADPNHPHAALVARVLHRVRIADSASSDQAGGLVIGRDGTFTIGPLHGRPAGVDDPAELLSAATHVGAQRRRQAALAHAEALERQANTLEGQAQQHDAAAAISEQDRRTLQSALDNLPSQQNAHTMESRRADTAATATQAEDAAAGAEDAATEKAEQAARLEAEWEQRTAARDLPIDVAELDELRRGGREKAHDIETSAAALTGKIRGRLSRLAEAATRDVTESGSLPRLYAEANTAAEGANRVAVEYQQLTETVGQDAGEAVAEHAAMSEQLRQVTAGQGQAQGAVHDAWTRLADLKNNVVGADANLDEATPRVEALRRRLRTYLSVPGVSEVLRTTTTAAATAGDAAGSTTGLDTADDIVATVGQALQGKPAVGRRTLRERYDTCRAELAGVWSLDPGETTEELDQFTLVHDSITYSPPAAAERGRQLKQRAQAALDAAEESALRDFVVGRLPSAIGTAWVHIKDWIDQVNRKMARASASSGVGVRVRATLSSDLTAAEHTAYRLSCQVGDSDRTVEQQREVGEALQSLIVAAEGETMAERLTNGVDVRQWLDIFYEIIRPDGQTQRWSSRTGLSGGERRLIVLAPMLASVAAFYDQLDLTGLRLAALDEVPAEVDEQGREGLARYIAELDLDLICTSYLWDGAPGAWDGVDAFDLEAGPDDTVVAFPMLVRGLDPIPGDSDWNT
jgi:hypothetical protein